MGTQRVSRGQGGRRTEQRLSNTYMAAEKNILSNRIQSLQETLPHKAPGMSVFKFHWSEHYIMEAAKWKPDSDNFR